MTGGQPHPADLVPGDFAAVVMHGAPGAAIRFGQWLNGDGFSDYEHALMYVGDGFIVQAMPHGAQRVRRVPLVQPGDLWSTGIIDLTPEQRAGAVAAANGYADFPHQEGRRPVGYSVLDYLALAAHRLHLWAPGLKRYIASSRHMQCAQLDDQELADGGYHLFDDGRWPGYVTPGAIAGAILSRERQRQPKGM